MNAKIATLIVLLSATAITLHVRGASSPVMENRSFDEFPLQMGDFHGRDQAITEDVRNVLGDGHFLSRSYVDTKSGEPAPIDLLIAYYPSQRSGQSIHSPQNCLPGAGWTFEGHSILSFQDSSQQQHEVAEYLISNGSTRMEVLYWYRSRGMDIASDFTAKWLLMVQAVRDGRTDGGLIRIMTPVIEGETQQQARARVTGFARTLDPQLRSFLPS